MPELGIILNHKKENFNMKLRNSIENAVNKLNIAIAQEVFISGSPFFESMLNNLFPELVSKRLNRFNENNKRNNSKPETQDENSFKIISSKVEKVSSNESEEEEEEEIEYKISIKLNKKDTNISSLSISFYGHNIDGLLFEKENVEITSSESDSSSFEGQIKIDNSNDNYKNSIYARVSMKDEDDNIIKGPLSPVEGVISDFAKKFDLTDEEKIKDDNDNKSTSDEFNSFLDQAREYKCSYAKNRRIATICLLTLNPILRKNFLIYALNKTMKNNSSIFLYEAGINLKSFDSTFIDKAFNVKWPFHYTPEKKEDEEDKEEKPYLGPLKTPPVGMSLKFGEFYFPIPRSIDLVNGYISYRPQLSELQEQITRLESYIIDLKFQKSDEISDPTERKLLYESLFMK